MMRTFAAIAGSLIAGCILIGLAGCSGSSSSSTPAASTSSYRYLATQSPGDVWNWTIGSSTFSATNVTKGITYSGTAELLPSGFYKLTVASTTNDNVPVGSVAYAFDVPGVAFIAQPAGSVTNPIVGAGIGNNPSGGGSYNWIAIPPSGWTQASSEAYGTVALTMTSSTVGTIDITSRLLNGSLIGSHSQTLTFTNGEFTTGENTGIVTPAGVFLVDDGPGNGGVVGMQAPSANVDITDLASHSYRGILFKGGSSQLIECTSNGTGGLDAASFTNVETDTIDTNPSDGVTVSFTSQSTPGLVNGQLTGSNGAQNMVFSTSQGGGKYIIYGFAVDTNGNPENFLLIQD